MMSWKCIRALGPLQGILLKDPPGSTQRQTTVEMGDGVMTVGMAMAWSHHPQPETAIALEHEHGLGRPFPMGLKQGHAELLGHFGSPGTRAQSAQDGR